MKRSILLLFLTLAVIHESGAQFTRYIIRFKNKGGSPYSFSNPTVFLSQRAIDRRTRYGIAIDSSDLPVTPSYINQVRAIPNVTLLNVSRWINGVTIQTSDAAAITAINALPFVQGTAGIAAREEAGRTAQSKWEPVDPLPPVQGRPGGSTADYYNYGAFPYSEIRLHNGEFLHNIGLRGQGMQIAMLDNGFSNYTALSAFDSINTNGQVLGTWDFVAREQNVANDGSHGMNCLSTIAANIPGQFVGKAPKASFWLYQTEDNASEYPIEEFNWVCGAERSDSTGADVISSSLGYFTFDNAALNYTYANMDGNTTISAKGADIAARKGLLVFVAAGNEGNKPWHYLISPSDADSVVAVAAVSSSGAIGGFSSYGPSSDGQIKPNMASVGVNAIVHATNNTIGTSNGTSFACPNMAGLATCLWQAFPAYNNMKIIHALQQAGSISTTPDDRIGYGIPNLKTAFASLLTEYATSNSSASGCRITINWNSKDVSAMKYEVERKAPGETVYTKIADVPAQTGTILNNRTYQYNNDLNNGSVGNYSYRIRQIIDTATAGFTAVYIDTTTINIGTACVVTAVGNPGQTDKQVYIQPNPVTGQTVTLVVETPQAIAQMPINVFDEKGSLIVQLQSSKGSGKKTIEISVQQWPAGKYYIRVMNGSRPLGTAELIRL
ncbi:MAG: S8 family peptidase [Chitinophagaceae bacterium]|nr:S8 family peptidase [Chitinophagaceae bacterium]